MHTYIMSFQRVCCWFAGAIDLGVLSGVEPCADVIVSAAVRRRSQNIGARGRGGGERFLTWRLLTWEFCPGSSRAPTSLCRRPRTSQFWSAAARRRSPKKTARRGRGFIVTFFGGGAPPAPKKIGAAARWLNCNIYRRPRRRRGGAATRRLRRGGGQPGRGAARRPQKSFRKISFYPRNFLMTFNLESENATNMVSVGRRQIFGGGTSITKRRRWRPQIIGGGSAGARLYLKDCYPIRLLCLLLYSSPSQAPILLLSTFSLLLLFSSPPPFSFSSSSPPSCRFLLLPLISLFSSSSSSNHYPSPLSSSSSALPLLLLLFSSFRFFPPPSSLRPLHVFRL